MPTPEALSADDQELWTSLGRVVQRLPRLLDDAMMRSAGLSMTEFSVLDALRECAGSARIGDLASRTGLSHSRVSRVVDTFAGRGWCHRERDEHDGRSAVAVLTDAGADRVAAAIPHHVRLAHDFVLSRVPPEARGAMVTVLSAIAAVDQAGPGHSPTR